MQLNSSALEVCICNLYCQSENIRDEIACHILLWPISDIAIVGHGNRAIHKLESCQCAIISIIRRCNSLAKDDRKLHSQQCHMASPCCYGNDPDDLSVDEQEGGQPGTSSACHGEPPLPKFLGNSSFGTKSGPLRPRWVLWIVTVAIDSTGCGGKEGRY